MPRQVTREPERLKRIAEAWQERCAALARKYHAYVVPWDYYVGEDGRVRNSSYILDREGAFVGRYCKCNLTASEQKKGIVHGTDYPVFDLDIGRVGIIICFDNYFPEAAAALGAAVRLVGLSPPLMKLVSLAGLERIRNLSLSAGEV